MAAKRTAATLDRLEIAPELFVVRAFPINDLREQDVNAHVMKPGTFDRLAENIRSRGQLESLPYCAQPGGEGPVEIVSGHHRVRAAKSAGLVEVPILLDCAEMTRSTIIAKQLAHNAIIGMDDPDLVKQLVSKIDTPDDLLATGLPQDVIGDADATAEAIGMFTPRIDFDYRTVSFAFLPHQQADLERLIGLLEGRQDLVVAAPLEQFDDLLKVAARFARIKGIKSGGTAITLMVRMALEEIERIEAENAQQAN
jgi:hypothetical protein